MDKRLNYHELLESWMQFYSLPAEASKKMFETIWMRLQSSKEKTNDKEENVERPDQTGEP